jgi:hypothetical protein
VAFFPVVSDGIGWAQSSASQFISLSAALIHRHNGPAELQKQIEMVFVASLVKNSIHSSSHDGAGLSLRSGAVSCLGSHLPPWNSVQVKSSLPVLPLRSLQSLLLASKGWAWARSSQFVNKESWEWSPGL